MRTLRFDSVGGASGDMILATFFDLGIDTKALRQQLTSLHIERFDIQEKSFSDYGMNGTQLAISTENPERLAHRHLNDIRKIINGSGLADSVKTKSMIVFERLAEAEAKVHGTVVDKVHFHEVGALDSIVDIVASCIALEMLEVDEIHVGPLPLGSGTVECEHGVLPVPVPATVELLKGHPVVRTDEPFELITPTGAAILTTWAGYHEDGRWGMENREQRTEDRRRRIGDTQDVIINTGNGFGHKKLNGRPNLLRAIIIETAPGADNVFDTTDPCLVLECNIDDTIPEILGSLSTQLLEKGALDVFTTSVQMKKQRPGTLLTVLCKPGDRETFLEIIFSESTTFGIRETMTQRTILERRHEEVETPYGKVRVKIGLWKGKDITRSPEHDDCVRCAGLHNVPVRTVYEAAGRTNER